MIPKMKDYRKCIGQGYAVWDQNCNVARKYICKGIKVEYDERGDALLTSLALQVKKGLRLYYSATDCFRTRRECMVENLRAGRASLHQEVLRREKKVGEYRRGLEDAECYLKKEKEILEEFDKLHQKHLHDIM